MLWRVRANLPDRPGALAGLAAACGEAGANILTLHVFPELGSVTDEIVLDLPAGADDATLQGLVEGAGGRLVAAAPCSEAALEDQATRYVRAVQRIIEHPTSFPEITAGLFDAGLPGPEESGDLLEATVAGVVTVQVRRDIPFTSVERARAVALADLVGDVLGSVVPSAESGTPVGEPDYLSDRLSVSALAAGSVVGRAVLAPTDGDTAWPVDITVDPLWQRRGIGTRLLSSIARIARANGAVELQLSAPADSPAALPMVLASGLRGRIRVDGPRLTVRISLADVRPTPVPA